MLVPSDESALMTLAPLVTLVNLTNELAAVPEDPARMILTGMKGGVVSSEEGARSRCLGDVAREAPDCSRDIDTGLTPIAALGPGLALTMTVDPSFHPELLLLLPPDRKLCKLSTVAARMKRGRLAVAIDPDRRC